MKHPNTIAGYEILEPLGQRGHGYAYLALQKTLGRRVILKVLEAGTDRARKQFEEECNLLTSLDDPRIVTIHDHGADGGTYYFAQDYIEGLSLCKFHQRIQAGDSLDQIFPGKRVPLRGFLIERMAQILEALDQMHFKGLVHRGIRPETILLDHAGRPFIADFGLARQGKDQSLSRSQELDSDASLLSPEQAAGRVVDYRTDIYAVGTILKSYLGEVDGELAAILEMATAETPGDRYMRARDFAKDLRSFLRGEGILAAPPSPARKFFRWSSRRKALLAGGAVIALLLACIPWLRSGVQENLNSFEKWGERVSTEIFRGQRESEAKWVNQILEQPNGVELMKMRRAEYERFVKDIAEDIPDIFGMNAGFVDPAQALSQLEAVASLMDEYRDSDHFRRGKAAHRYKKR